MLHSNTKLGRRSKSKIIPQKQRHKSNNKDKLHTGEIKNGKVSKKANRQLLQRMWG